MRDWELLILDADPGVGSLVSLVTGDIDGDGHIEVFTGGTEGLLWYRPDTFEKGVIDQGAFHHVGLILADVDGDGQLELVSGRNAAASGEPDAWELVYHKPGVTLSDPWTRIVVDDAANGGAHDILFVDVDGDGRGELIANAALCPVPGLYLYKSTDDPALPWQKTTIVEGMATEGLAAADLNSDGRLEIIAGPNLFVQPAEGPYQGDWQWLNYAPNFREMCRVEALDVNNSGRPDIILVDSEYMDGRLSWFENRWAERDGTPDSPFVEHLIEASPLVYAHSLHVWQEGTATKLFLAEMAQGGWSPPYNWHARQIFYTSTDNGQSWQREVAVRGQGTHEADAIDVDGDGRLEIVGKETWRPKMQIWRQPETPSPIAAYRHSFVDRDKPHTGIDIVAADIDGDGQEDIVCGAWWYQAPSWTRREIPGIYQVINAYDIDGDGQLELIATRKSASASADNWYTGLSSELCWLKARDPLAGDWQIYDIGVGHGDWPHGNVIAPLLPGGQLALVAAYHSAHAGDGHVPEIFAMPDDPTLPWPKRPVADIQYGEEMAVHDITGNGLLDIVAGPFWLENRGDGTFEPYRLVADPSFYSARLRLMDVNSNGRLDVVLGEEVLNFEQNVAPFSRLAWFEQPDDPRQPWPMHIIDTMRCPHSVEVADLDGDGELEIIAGEHDPFWPYRNQCRLHVYKRATSTADAWVRHTLPGHYEHHDGTKAIALASGKTGIISHGWKDDIYVHLWR